MQTVYLPAASRIAAAAQRTPLASRRGWLNQPVDQIAYSLARGLLEPALAL
jgi:hypothetical protein